jgi:hypothetical protein
MEVYRPIRKERQASNPRATKTTYTKGRTSYSYNDTLTKPNTAYSLQLALR